MRIFLLAAILLSSRAVSLRMSMDTVAALCREPTSATEYQETVWETSVTYVRREPVVTQIPHEITRTEGTFDFGHDRFVRYLSFANGVLTRIREGGYGT